MDRTVRLWGNDWNVRRRVASNQEKLDHVLFGAEKMLRKYHEMQSNVASMKVAAHSQSRRLSVPQFMTALDSVRSQLRSMDHYLGTFVFDRLSRMENALVRIFQQSQGLQEDPVQSDSNRTIKRFSVDELMNQLDSQRLNFDGQFRKKSEQIAALKEELAATQLLLERERAERTAEQETHAALRGDVETERALNQELAFDLKAVKSQLQRLSTLSNQFGTSGGANIAGSSKRGGSAAALGTLGGIVFVCLLNMLFCVQSNNNR